MNRRIAVIFVTLCFLAGQAAAEKPVKVFILAGQSNMVGWGNSLELPDRLRSEGSRVLMFEGGKWQRLRPFRPAQKNQEKYGMTEHSFGPEMAMADEMARVWPDETIGIVKFAVGGTSILANLKSLATAVREDTGVADLPFLCASPRRSQDPDDISDLVPNRVEGSYPSVEWVLKAQWDAQQEIANCRTVILRDIETHPRNVHYNTAGQLEVGKLFSEAFVSLVNSTHSAE